MAVQPDPKYNEVMSNQAMKICVFICVFLV